MIRVLRLPEVGLLRFGVGENDDGFVVGIDVGDGKPPHVVAYGYATREEANADCLKLTKEVERQLAAQGVGCTRAEIV